MSTLRALNGRTQIIGEVVVTRCVVRRQTMRDVALEAISAWLKRESFTGTVTLGVAQGHIRTMSAEDRQDIPG